MFWRLAKSSQSICTGLISVFLASCGTVTPSFTEFWESDQGSTQQKVVNIAAQVSCELQQSIEQLVAQDKYISRTTKKPRNLAWLEEWGVLVTLTLNVIEKTDFTPGISYNQPLSTAITRISGQNISSPQSFTLGFGGQLTATATRNGIVHMFYTVKDLLNSPPSGTTCIPSQPAPGFVFVESQLGIKEWLYAATGPQFLGLAAFPATKDKGPLGQDAISQEFKFQVFNSSGINPSWKLVNISGNTNSNLLSGSRDRFQDLLITLGPLDETISGRTVLAPAAQGLHQAQQFGVFTASALNR